MKELNANELKKIAYNCRKATFLIEKQQVEKITAREQLELKIHLAGCSICVTFMQQSLVINQMVKKLFQSDAIKLKLDDSFKHHLQKRIEDHLEKN